MVCPTVLKPVAEPELQDPGIAGAGDPAEKGGVEAVFGLPRFTRLSELKHSARNSTLWCSPGHREDLEQREIEIGGSGSHQSVAAQRAERARRTGGMQLC